MERREGELISFPAFQSYIDVKMISHKEAICNIYV